MSGAAEASQAAGRGKSTEQQRKKEVVAHQGLDSCGNDSAVGMGATWRAMELMRRAMAVVFRLWS